MTKRATVSKAPESVVVLPGFGDTPRYWAKDMGQALGGGALHLVEWAGLWGEKSAPDPVQDTVERAAALVSTDTVVVGHSLGARVALSVAARTKPTGVVLLAPALGPLSFLAEQELSAWRRTGVRMSARPDPVTGCLVEVSVPVAFAEGVLILEVPTPRVPVLVITMSSDERHNNYTRELLPAAAVVAVPGEHRFWEDSATCVAVMEELSRWRSATFSV